MHLSQTTPPKALTLFYDGDCRLCRAEMIYLSARDTSNQLGFVDVRQHSALDPLHGVSCEVALANIHAKTADGQTLIGVAAFQVAYGLVGLTTLSKLLGIKALQPIFKYAYRSFAKHRFTLSKLMGGAALKMVKLITKKDHV